MNTNMNTNKKILNRDPEEKWNEWFAGVTDGDGYFCISKKEKSISYEVTVAIPDARVVYDIKNRLKAGSVHKRSNSQSVRYRVKANSVIQDIVYRLNGKLHNKTRLDQVSKVCKLLNMRFIQPTWLIEPQSAYLAGLIDSDGTFTINVGKSTAEDSQISGVRGRTLRLANSRGSNQLRLRITSKYVENLTFLQQSYKIGVIYRENKNKENRSPNNKFHWTITEFKDFQNLYEYLKLLPLKSTKMHRMRLVFIYFKYKQLRYHLAPESTLEFKLWKKLSESWFKYSF